MKRRNDETILIVEDDEAIRQTLKEMIELNGFCTIVASNGLEGLSVARQQVPSLIITDIAMPGLTAFELIPEWRRDEALRSVPVIVISASLGRSAHRRCMELGADDFITKPFTEQEVINSIVARLEKKELLEELDAFVQTMAHDIKNPIAALCGRLDVAGLMLGKVDEATLRQQLTGASLAARRIDKIINELLTISGVRGQSVVPRELDMGALVAESLRGLEDILMQHSIAVQLPETWPVAVGYAPWIVHVWTTCIGNAANNCGSDPQVSVGWEPGADGRTAIFWVQDNGPGFEENALDNHFELTKRRSTVIDNDVRLGLSTMRRIVEKLRGKVGVVSSPGAGARFWFELPTSVHADANVGHFVPPDS